MKRFRWLGAIGLTLLVVGCQTTRYTPPKPLTGDALIDGHNAIETAPVKDKVLWQYRTAVTAMRRGQFAEAKRLLDEAIARVSNTMGNDASAKKSRGYFNAEAKKTFIGEPYERVMAYYYRGLLYWMDGEPDNARACFRSAQLQDSDTVDKKYANDYVLLDYLDGYATAKLGDDGSDALKRAIAEAKISTPPATYDQKANVLFFVEFGEGPTKYATGEYAENLMFRGGVSRVRAAQLRIADKAYQLRPYDDLYFQATTRGGRVMDHILANKAGFKKTTDTVGNAALLSGLVLAGRRETQGAALGVAAFGLISKLTAAGTTPEADIRSWDNLPLFLTFASIQLPAGQHTATVEFLDDVNHVLPGLTKTITLTVPEGKDKVVYVSDKSTSPQNL
ncbi:MAG: hypothetical protein JWM16_4134 [Verrucomicrobiales bacterium]|nr:hypothetical protein [Verrucomicrobiales bacterium]